jgi:hypothetical protein
VKNKNAGRKPLPEKDLSDCTMHDIARLFGVSASAVAVWECPRLPSGLYNAPDVVRWKLAAAESKATPESKAAAEARKLELQCQKLQLELDDKNKNTVPRADFDEAQQQGAVNFRDWFTGYGRQNLHCLVGQPIEKIREYWDDLVKSGVNTFLDTMEKFKK